MTQCYGCHLVSEKRHLRLRITLVDHKVIEHAHCRAHKRKGRPRAAFT